MSSYKDATCVAELNLSIEKNYTYYVTTKNGEIVWRMLTECYPDCIDTDKVCDVKIDTKADMFYFVGKDGNVYESSEEKYAPYDYKAAFEIYNETGLSPITNEKLYHQDEEEEEERVNKIKESIVNILIKKGEKMTASDIDAFIKHQNVEEVKQLCEGMYHDDEIGRTSNYRYFQKDAVVKSKKINKNSNSTEKDIKKLKVLLDDGLINQEQYNAKVNEILGI